MPSIRTLAGMLSSGRGRHRVFAMKGNILSITKQRTNPQSSGAAEINKTRHAVFASGDEWPLAESPYEIFTVCAVLREDEHGNREVVRTKSCPRSLV